MNKVILFLICMIFYMPSIKADEIDELAVLQKINQKVSVYYRSLNNAELSYVSEIESVEGKNLFSEPNGIRATIDGNSNTYMAGINGRYPQVINLHWKEKIAVYRIWIEWYSTNDISDDFIVEANDGTGFKSVLSISKDSFYVDGGASELAFPEVMNINAIRLTFFSAKGQNRVLIKELGVY